MSAYVEAALLIAVAGVAVGLLLWRRYRENWLQWFGLATIAVAAGILFDIDRSLTTGEVMLSVGVLLFLIGLSIKVLRHKSRSPRV